MENVRKTRATLKDVAERSGYGLRTVKKVINNDPNVSSKSKTAIMRAMSDLNYTRNQFASALAKNRATKIAIVYSPITKTYFPEVEKGFNRCAKEFLDFGMSIELFLTNRHGYLEQKSLLEEILIRDDIDGVVVQPVSASLLDDCINALVNAGKPVITFGADAPKSKRMCYVGPNAYKAGRIGGQILANYIGKQGRVFIITQISGHMQTLERKHGFLDRMNEHYPNIETYELNIPENSDLYYDMVKSIIANENVAGLFCTDANTYIAGEVLRDLGRTDIAVVGFDMSETANELMKCGYIKVIIEQSPELFSYLALKAMFENIYYKKKTQEIIHTGLSIVTSECLTE